MGLRGSGGSVGVRSHFLLHGEETAWAGLGEESCQDSGKGRSRLRSSLSCARVPLRPQSQSAVITTTKGADLVQTCQKQTEFSIMENIIFQVLKE